MQGFTTSSVTHDFLGHDFLKNLHKLSLLQTMTVLNFIRFKNLKSYSTGNYIQHPQDKL